MSLIHRRRLVVTTPSGAECSYLRTPLGVLPRLPALLAEAPSTWRPRSEVDPASDVALRADEERREVLAALRRTT